MEIPGVEKFKIQAILDTGTTVCCVHQNAVPKEALEPSAYPIQINERDGIQMLIGCNFIRVMQGGLRIEGQMVTFYKNVTTIATRVDAEVVASAAIEELELSEVEYFEI
ncbi:polyprotein [Rhynchospora pubera]|uniref:Polyprotein n=1 Tax=Rhynchospora pubera TaxID=906938 RepID=A0AAV8BYG5_9POAL|nr:polyprotein [Rhynchospora pubera]